MEWEHMFEISSKHQMKLGVYVSQNVVIATNKLRSQTSYVDIAQYCSFKTYSIRHIFLWPAWNESQSLTVPDFIRIKSQKKYYKAFCPTLQRVKCIYTFILKFKNKNITPTPPKKKRFVSMKCSRHCVPRTVMTPK